MSEARLLLKIEGDNGSAKAALVEIRESSTNAIRGALELGATFKGAGSAGEQAFRKFTERLDKVGHAIDETVDKAGNQLGKAMEGLAGAFGASDKAAGLFGNALDHMIGGNYLGAFIEGAQGILEVLTKTPPAVKIAASSLNDFAGALDAARARMKAKADAEGFLNEALNRHLLTEKELANIQELRAGAEDKISSAQAASWALSKERLDELADSVLAARKPLEDSIALGTQQADEHNRMAEAAENAALATTKAAIAHEKEAGAIMMTVQASRELQAAMSQERLDERAAAWVAIGDAIMDLPSAIGAAEPSVRSIMERLNMTSGTGGGLSEAGDMIVKSLEEQAKAKKELDDAFAADPYKDLKSSGEAWKSTLDDLRKSLMVLAEAGAKAFTMLITGQKGAGKAFGDAIKEMLQHEATWAGTKAIEAGALALWDLAIGDVPGAAAAGAAAAGFAAAAAAAGVGAAIAGPTSSQSASSPGGAANANTTGTGMQSGGSGPSQTNLHIYIGAAFLDDEKTYAAVAKGIEQAGLSGGFQPNKIVTRTR